MFRGSPGLSKDQLAKIAAAMGGDFNADTHADGHAVLFTVPSGGPGTWPAYRSARMRGADASDRVEHERGAIEQEVSGDLSDPAGRPLHALLWRCSAARRMSTMRWARVHPSPRPRHRCSKKFQTSWYAPNNAILVIAGDVDPAATMAR